MTRSRVTHLLTVSLGVLFVIAGIVETTRAVVTGDGGIPFWFGSLVGGGAVILLGTLAFPRHPRLYCGLVWLGCVAGTIATLWTLVIPLVALTVIVLAFLRTGEEIDRQALTRGT
jgi:hypothetical protein